MSRATGQPGSTARVGKPYVVERWNHKTMTYTPVRNHRFATAEEAVADAKKLGSSAQVVIFDDKTRKPTVLWKARRS